MTEPKAEVRVKKLTVEERLRRDLRAAEARVGELEADAEFFRNEHQKLQIEWDRLRKDNNVMVNANQALKEKCAAMRDGYAAVAHAAKSVSILADTLNEVGNNA